MQYIVYIMLEKVRLICTFDFEEIAYKVSISDDELNEV